MIRTALYCIGILTWVSSAQAQMAIELSGGTVTGNASAVAAFNRAAAQWTDVFSDQITVSIDADFTTTGFASASFFLTGTSYTGAGGVRELMVDSATGGDINDDFVTSLPASITFNIDGGGTITNPTIFMTRPNARALGLTTSGSDGTIFFNSNINWDYDNSDGIDSGAYDFESVAAHEIGHILGFADNVGGTTDAYAMDVFRFSFDDSGNPDDLTEWQTFNRELTSGIDTVFDYVNGETRFTGGPDASQSSFSPSHWFNNDLSPAPIGVMDPEIFNEQIITVGLNDILLLDAIGYDRIAAIPEPSTYAMMGFAMLVSVVYVRRKKRLPAHVAA